MAEIHVPKESGGSDEAEHQYWGDEERKIFQGQRWAEKDLGLFKSSRSLPGCLARAPLPLMVLLISLGLFMLLLTTLVQVSRIQQSLPREMDHRGSHSPVVNSEERIQSDLEEIHQQLTWMNATLTRLCRSCPWNWEFFRGSCYFFSRSQNTWKGSVSACEEMNAQLVIIDNAEEQKFLQSWDIRNNKRTWIGLSDQHHEGSWHWVDNTPLHLSFWKEGEPNNVEDEDCVELRGDGWNDSKCNTDFFWICEKTPSQCSGL